MEESITILFDQIPLGIITFSRNGDVEYVNQRLQQLSILYQFNTSWQNLNLFKQDIFTSASLVREMRNVIAGNSFEKEVKQIDKLSGEYIYLTVKGSPYYEGENITRGIVIIEDNKVPSGITREYSFKSKFTEHLLDKNKQFIIVTDLRGDIKFSFGSESLSPKLNRKDITGKNIGEVFHPSENQKILEAYDAAVIYRTTQNVNLQVLSGDSDIDISCTIEPFLTKKGLIELLYLIFTQAPDEKKISESFLEELIKSNFYHQISERREFAFLLIGNQGELICGYDQLEKILGLESKYSKVEYIGDIFPVLRPHEIQWINRRIQTGHSYEITAITRDSRFGNKPVNLIFTKTQESEVTIVVCIPIPQEINQAQSRNYKSSSDSYRIEQIADPICKIDNKGTILYANRAFKSRLMFSDIDLYEKNFFELFYTKTIANIKAELSTLAKGEIKTIQAKIIDGTNSELEANLSFKVENLIDEKPHTIYCFMGNIYDLEEERSHLNIYQSLFREASNGMAVESEEKIILANESFSELFGFTNSSDIEGKHILDFVSEEDVSKVSNFFLLKKTGRPAPDKIEFLARKLDGSSVHIEYNITVLRENDNTFFAIYALDITEKKREKRGMIESEQKYRNLTENINDFLYTFERIKKYFKPIFFI
jgi:PAS domain S-box-containing protein